MTGSAPPKLPIDPQTTALLVVDLQNDTVGEQGAFADSGAAEFATRHGVVEKVKRLVEAARAAGMPIVHIHHLDSPGYVDATLNAPLFQSIVDADALVRGTWGGEPITGLEPQAGDHVVEKQRMSSFNGTSLDVKLRGLGTRKIVVCGAWTNFAVEHTCRDGADLGYEVVIVSDGTATISDEWQRAALTYALTRIAEQATVDELMEGLAIPAASGNR
jgi:nicotinamidase-related amidase